MKLSRRSLLGYGSAATAGLAASQAFNTQPATAQRNSKRVVNLYSSRHYNTDNELYDTFTLKTGIKVNLIEGKADALMERIKNEGSRSPADVFMTVDASRLWRAEQAGLFRSVSSDEINKRIPANLRHPQGFWFGFSKRARVIMYNRNRVSGSQLSTYEDLASSKWRGKIAIRSSSNIYNQSLMASIVAAVGERQAEAWAKGFVANFARKPKGNDRAQIEAAAAGISDLAIANTYYLPRYAKDSNPKKKAIFNQMKVFFPNQSGRGTHINISGAGMVKTAPHRAEAIAFLEYLASPLAQVFFAQANNEYPAMPGVPLDPIVAGFGSFKADNLNVAQYGRYNAAAVKIMDRVGWT